MNEYVDVEKTDKNLGIRYLVFDVFVKEHRVTHVINFFFKFHRNLISLLLFFKHSQRFENVGQKFVAVNDDRVPYKFHLIYALYNIIILYMYISNTR